MLSFLVADGHAIDRIGIVCTLMIMFNECHVEEAQNGIEMLAKLSSKNFDVLITDIGIDEADNLSAALLVRPALKVLIFSNDKESIYAAGYIRKGALGYIEKGSSRAEVEKAIHSVVNGTIYISPTMTMFYAQGRSLPAANGLGKLSYREREICILLCSGKGISQIAELLDLTVSKVGMHKKKIMNKAGAINLAELLKMAKQQSW